MGVGQRLGHWPARFSIQLGLALNSQFRQEPHESWVVAPSFLTSARTQLVELSTKTLNVPGQRVRISLAVGQVMIMSDSAVYQ